MVLKPGDSVNETCERVGNFPHGILKEPDNLQLDPGVLGSVPALSSEKEQYIQKFDDNGLVVCEETQPFAKQGQPYILDLKKKDETPPPPITEADKRYVFMVHFMGQGFREATVCTPGIWVCGEELYHSSLIYGLNFHWSSDLGSITFPLKMHQYMTEIAPEPPFCGCPQCSPSGGGNVTITSYWDAETMNHKYLTDNGISWYSVIVAELTVTTTGLFGSASQTIPIRASGYSFFKQASAGGQATCYDDGNPYNHTELGTTGGVSIMANELDRWQLNYAIVNNPTYYPPPGFSWPPMIDDPSHPTY